MKKLLLLVLIAYFCYFSIGCFIDYSVELSDIITGKDTVEIEKPDNMSNTEFASLLEETASKSRTDILYSTLKFRNNEYVKLCYITQNNVDFIQGLSKSKYESIKSNGYIESKTLYENINFYKFSDIVEYNLDKCKYYVSADASNSFVSNLITQNVSASKINEVHMTQRFINIRSQIYPMCIVFFSMIFFIINKRNVVVIKRLHGYSTINIIKDEIMSFLKKASIISAISFFVTVIIHTILFPNEYRSFSLFLLGRFIVVFSIILIAFLLVSFLFFLPISQLDIKGRNQNKQLFILSFAFKSAVILMAVVYLSVAVDNVMKIYNVNKTYKYITEKVMNYIDLPLNISSVYVSENDFETLDHNLLDFYKSTVDEFSVYLLAPEIMKT